jgi:hypothetical protein
MPKRKRNPYTEQAQKIARELDIDLLALEEEWVNQPQAFFMASARLARQRERLDAFKGALSVARADADKEIRDDPEAHGLTKVTEAAVANAVNNHQDVRTMEKKVREQQYKVHLCAGAVDAYEHRKRALESLVKLQGMEYYADPQAGRQNTEFVEKVRRPRGVKDRRAKPPKE